MKKLFILIALSLVATPTWASIAFVHANNAVSAAVNSTTVSLAVTSTNVVIGVVTWDNAVSAVLDHVGDNGTGGTWVVKITTPDNGNGEGNAAFYGYGWSVAPTTITATYNMGSTPSIAGITVAEFSGQATGDPIDGTNFQSQLQASPGTGTDGAKSGAGNLTPGANNYLVWGGSVDTGALNNSGASEFTAGTSFTEGASSEHQVNGELSFSQEYWIQTTATAANASFTVTQNTAHVTFMMVFKNAVTCTPSKVVFTAQPSNAVIGAVLGTVSVSVEDSGSNVCTSDTSTVTITNNAGCTGMTLGGTASGSAVSGVFTTTNLTENAAGTCTLHAADGALTAGDSSSFTVSAAATHRMLLMGVGP